MMGLGVPEMIFIFGAALLLFGPRKLPEIGRTLGKGMAEFRKASAELKRSLDTEAIENEVRETQRAIQEHDPRKYLREAAAFDERRVARSNAKPEAPAAEDGVPADPATDSGELATAEPTPSVVETPGSADVTTETSSVIDTAADDAGSSPAATAPAAATKAAE